MSHPFRFNQEEGRSPLDRQPPNLFTSGQPPSFKTNVNRMKTKKWVEAKANTYDGGDWGDYDEYDEYGTEQEPQPPSISTGPTGLRQKGQTAAEPSRSFTDPQRFPPPQVGRRHSFEAGDEQRAFFSANPQSGNHREHGNLHAPDSNPPEPAIYAAPQPQQPYIPQPQISTSEPSPAPDYMTNRRPSGAASDISDTPQNRRDFSPSALPPPLSTRMSPAPGSGNASPAGHRFPARKSSLSQMDSPAGMNAPASAVSPRERAPSNPSKPLPFIRPADIYKRLEEERSRERTSMESSRPSLDSLSSRPVQDPASSGALKERESSESLGRSAEAGRSLQPLETVAERKSEYLPEFDVSSQRPQQDRRQPAETSEPVRSAVTTSQLPSLPPVQRISTFDDDFWLSSSQQRGSAKDIAATSPLDDGGLRSIVDQAFTRVDDGQSASPTPISKQEDSGISRSNTDSTVSISPIMSRVPSSAVSALKTRNAEGQSNTPVIVEETSGTDTPVIQERLGNSHQIPRKPSPSHSRNISSTSISQAGLTPSPHDSPARSPAIEPRKPLPEPESALVDTFSALSPESVDAGLPGPSSAYTIREADIASEIRASPDKALELGIAEKESRNSFLESHPSPPAQLAEAAPRSRSESPSKGRVHELANKFGHVSHSRRGSTQSNASRSSVQSWERSQENSRPSSPVKIEADRSVRPVGDLQGERPPAAHELSFRPKLPGQWESFATSVPTPSDQGDKDVQLGNGSERASEQVQEPSPLNEVDLTPTTAKRPVATSDPMEPSPEPSSDPIAAVKAAGSAIGDAIKASVGLDVPGHTDQSYSVGDVYLPPLKLDRTASSVASSAPPTPPAKDTPLSEFPPPPPLKTRSPEPASSSNQQQTPTRPTVLPQLSTEPSIHDQESDRLRKEIVASLSPLRTSEAAHLRSPSGSLQPLQPGAANRESSILPSEYDSYWADEDPYPHQSNDPEQKAVDFPVTNLSQAPLTAPAAQPSTGPQSILPTRFSWEDHQGSVSVASEPPAQSIAQAPTVTKGEPETGTLMVNKDQEESKQGTPVEAERTPRPSPTPPPASLKDEASAAQAETAKPKTPVHHEGLHVVNTEVDPEAVDLPARLNPEVREAVQRQQEQPSTPSVSNQIEVQQVDASGVLGPTNIQHNTSVSLTSDEKPLGFREITAITSTPERIATFNRTREQWATADQGLQEWIASALTANPSLASQPLTAPQMPLSAASRHKTGPSLSLFGKHHTSSHVQSQGTPQDQYSASPVTATPSLSASAAHAQTYNLSVSSSGGRSASAKGKDLLHTAGVLGGKGMTSAKGLFAKGKSRFRASGSGDKAFESSREPSEEPELITTPESDARPTTASESLKDEKRKRRLSLSSPFHRSSRSRSRPTSIVLPSNPLLDLFSGSKSTRNTPPRETPSSRGGSRPHSYAAPDSWNAMGGPIDPFNQSIPSEGGLHPPERLGVLPSPAKSAFSLFQPDMDKDIPPVPPLPASIEEMRREGKVEDDQTNLLQSVIRNSTPPTMELQPCAVFTGERPEPEIPTSETEISTTSEPKMFVPVKGKEGTGVLEIPENAVEDGPTPTLEKQRKLEGTQEDDDQPPQLTYEPIPPLSFPRPAHESLDISPPTAAKTPDIGDVSPVVGSIDSNSVADAEEKRPTRRDNDRLSVKPNTSLKRDVSPMLILATTHLDKNKQHRAAYETGQIGAGDVSPVSSHASDDTTPTMIRKGTPPIRVSEYNTSAADLQASRAPAAKIQSNVEAEDLTPVAPTPPFSGENLTAPPQLVTSHPRLIQSPYQVVHAVQYVPSHSSMESWEQESSVALSRPDSRRTDDNLGDDINTFVAPVPHIVQEQQEKVEQTQELIRGSNKLEPPEESHALEEHRPRVGSSHYGSHQQSTAHRKGSLLSAISSAVSEDDNISPTSDKPSKFSPVTANRMSQPSTAGPSPAHSPNVGESIGPKSPPFGTVPDDEYDLYADHNGIVKDVKDERTGQPLRVATAQAPMAAPVARIQEPVTNARPQFPHATQGQGEASRKNSYDRRMSFISSYRDANGMPQDQINRPTPPPPDKNLPPLPRIASTPLGNFPSRSVGPKSDIPHGPPLSNEGRTLSRPQEAYEAKQVFNSIPSQRPEDLRRSAQNSVSPPQQKTPPLHLSQRPLFQGQQPKNGTPHPPVLPPQVHIDQRLPQDPRLQGMFPGQPHPHAPVQPRIPRQQLFQDPSEQGLAQDNFRPSRNEYEAQQQFMRRQAMDPRLRTVEYQLPGVGPPQFGPESGKSEDSSMRPRLSVFKSLGNRASSKTPPSSNPGSDRINPTLTAPDDQHRSFSYQSSVGDLPAEQIVGKKKERKTSIFGSRSSRPQSVGTDSLQSTAAQPAASRVDLRYPTSPPPSQGIPPHQPPAGALDALKDTKPQRTSASAAPELGKKKRFSALGNLFKSSIPGKGKLTKEEKKSQKVQKHESLPVSKQSGMQPPPAQQWPLKQIGQQQQYGIPTGQPRPFPGMHGVSPPPVPQKNVPQQGYQPTPQRLNGFNPPQFPQRQSEDSNQRSGNGSQAPPTGGYYAPRLGSKRWTYEPSASAYGSTEQQQQNSPQRHVSSPVSPPDSGVMSPISQRSVSSPMIEPQYQTPHIPAAYNRVSGAQGQPPRPSLMHQGSNMSGHQYSDPHMPNISPQVSAPQMPGHPRTYSDSSSASVVSPISNPSPSLPTPPTFSQRPPQKPRMTSITENMQQERAWNVTVNLPAGATNQEIVRVRHQQHIEQLHQQQQLAATSSRQLPPPHIAHQTRSPSPQVSQNTQLPQPQHAQQPPSALQGFREVLPRSSPQPYPIPQPPLAPPPDPQLPMPPIQQLLQQPVPIHPDQGHAVPTQPAAYPLPQSPNSMSITSPVNPLADALPPPPPPKVPHSQQMSSPQPHTPSPRLREAELHQQHPYQPPQTPPPPPVDDGDDLPPADSPPPYSDSSVPGSIADKAYPADLKSNADSRGRQAETRPRQPSLGLLQHPQPATMSASPQRSPADMGADILRRQLLEQEEAERLERIQKAELERQESRREHMERERARQRARELERSVSGGGRVGSLRDGTGGTSGIGRGLGPLGSTRSEDGGRGWVRRGSGGVRAVFELPAEEDEEPVMRGASYPGMEWTPRWDGD